MQTEVKRQIIFASLVSALVTLVVTGGFVAIFLTQRDEVFKALLEEYVRTEEFEENTSAGRFSALGEEGRVVSVVEKVHPAVVSISVSREVSVVSSDPWEDLFERFFGIPNTDENEDLGTEQRQVGGGSGFFVSADGHVITNKHVVEATDATYTVITNDGRSLPATVLARDPFVDIAVLKVEGSGFPYLEFEEELPRLGETVIAIGNALAEFSNTVSKGVVSGLARSIVAGGGSGQPELLDQVIQTDAAINPGNSGGPLINLSGKVVGVNVAVALESENIGFALPTRGLAGIVESVQTHGRIIHPYLGVRYVPITEDVEREYGIESDHGVLVVAGTNDPAIVPNSPAHKAGIKEGDILLEFDGERITSDRSLATLIREKSVGDTVTLLVLRGGERLTINVVLEEYKN